MKWSEIKIVQTSNTDLRNSVISQISRINFKSDTADKK